MAWSKIVNPSDPGRRDRKIEQMLNQPLPHAANNPHIDPRRAPRGSVIASRKTPTLPVVDRHRCTICAIEWEAAKGQPAACPLCDARATITNLRHAIAGESNRANLLTQQVNRMRADVDITVSMREAAPLLNQDDLIFLKAVLYQWREDKGVQLRTIHAAPGPAQRKGAAMKSPPRAVGFLLITRHGSDPEVHECSSVGGAALAAYYDQATREWSNVRAMELLMRTLASQLAITEK